MLRSAAQRAFVTLRPAAERSVLAEAFREGHAISWLSALGLGSTTSLPARGLPLTVVHHFHGTGFACQQPQPKPDEPLEAKREESNEPHAKMELNKHAGTDKPKRFDQGHIEPQPDNDPAHRSSYMLSSPAYSREYVDSISPQHKEPSQMYQRTGLWAVTIMRWTFDKFTNYGPKMSEAKWMTRILFLETVAGVPGMVGAMLRHLRSLRSFKRDHGWIHTLLEEAENERMHLLTFLSLKQPNVFFRAAVLGAQGVFFNLYTAFYMLSPRHCHAFVGYLEEEAVKTYTHCLHDIDSGKLPEWATKRAPEIAISYWQLDKNATMRDVILAVRADEAGHSHVNHVFSEMKALDDNPFQKHSEVVP